MANINKNEIGYNEVLNAGTANALMVQYKRANAAPLDITEVFTSKEYADDYAAHGATSYAGQVIAVAGEGIETKVYKITSGGTLVELIDETALVNVGKINEIRVNDKALTIDDNKSVNIDLSNYATQAYVSEEIAKAMLNGEIDLTGYATEQWVEDKGYITANDESITSKAAATAVTALEGKVTKLIGEDTNQSIREIAKNEISLLVGNASDALDTIEEIAAWIEADSAGTIDLVQRIDTAEGNIKDLQDASHEHENKEILDGIDAERVAKWDAAEENAKMYATSAAAQTLVDANAYADSLASNYDEAGAAAQALVDANAYADSLAENYEVAGAAATAEQNAKDYADSLAENYEVAGAAATAEQNAKDYADSLTENYASADVVNTLIGEDTNKSVRTIAEEEVAKIVGSASDALDTIEEIAAWIEADSAGTIDLVNKVSTIEGEIETLKGDSHTHTNKELLDTYTQTEENLADAVAKKHAHENAEVLNGINAEKVAAWDAAQTNAETFATNAVASALTEAKTYTDEVSAATLTAAQNYVDEKVVTYESGIATNIDEENKINVLVQASTESQTNYLQIKEDNSLAVNQVGLKDAVTTKEILVEGGEWADAVKKVFTDGKVPAGTSWESFLESMLCVEKFVTETITTTNNFSVTCSSPAAGIEGASNNTSGEVGTKVTLKAISAKDTTATQSITVKTFNYGYKLGENGAYNSSTAYTETLEPTLTNSSRALKEDFTKFTDVNGTALVDKTGTNSMDAIDMYVAEGENKVVVSQTGDTYQGSTTITADTIYVATNLKNYYKTDKATPNTYTPFVDESEKTASASTTYKVYGYRNTFYGVISSTGECDAELIRSLSASNKGIAANGTLTITTTAGESGNRMIIASPRTIKSVKNATATQDITTTLTNTLTTIAVPGANNYTSVDYNVYDYTWKEAFGSDTWNIIFN